MPKNEIVPTTEPWGNYLEVYRDGRYWARALTIDSGESLSLHYHQYRTELWYPLSTGLIGSINGDVAIDLLPGVVYSVPHNVLHSVRNPTPVPLQLLEVAAGDLDDNDIICIYNRHGD